MADDTLIKGWEVAKRTCNGRERGPLRKAAREVNGIRNSVLEGKASDAMIRKYLAAVETLHNELAKAGEQDFDGMLGEALEWFKATEEGDLAHRLPVPAELTAEQIAALERIRDYRFTNSPGHIGRAIDRDLRIATELAKEVRAGLSAMTAAASREELEIATKSYVDAADHFCAELARAGEPDFDGLLRQAVLVLDSAPGMANKISSTPSQVTPDGSSIREVGKSKKGSKSCGKGTKDGGKLTGHKKGDNYASNSNAKGSRNTYYGSSGKGEAKQRTWYPKVSVSAWPDERSWGA